METTKPFKESANTSGKVAATFLASSIAIIVLGVLTYIRSMQPWVEWLLFYKPAAQYSGIFFYSEVIWALLWAGLYFALRKKDNMGNIKIWLIFFISSLSISTAFIMASLKWTPLW